MVAHEEFGRLHLDRRSSAVARRNSPGCVRSRSLRSSRTSAWPSRACGAGWRRPTSTRGCEKDWQAAIDGALSTLGDTTTSQVSSLRNLHSNIKRTALQAKVVAFGYPYFFASSPQGSCSTGGGVTQSSMHDQPWVNTQIARMTSVISAAARATGTVFAGTANALDGHTLCSDQPRINSAIPSHAQESFHPNSAGNAAMATAVQVGFSSETVFQVYCPEQVACQHRVRAQTSNGVGPASNTAKLTNPLPSAPQSVAAVRNGAGSYGVQVTWKLPATTGGTPLESYVLEYSADAGASWGQGFDAATGRGIYDRRSSRSPRSTVRSRSPASTESERRRPTASDRPATPREYSRNAMRPRVDAELVLLTYAL